MWQRSGGQGGEYSIYNLPKNSECELLPIEGYLVDEVYYMFEEGMYFYVFYCLSFLSR